MLLGALFLGIGGQASNIREIQTLSMPVTMLQVGVFFLAVTVVGSDGGALTWFAYLFPFSSPMAMIAHGGGIGDAVAASARPGLAGALGGADHPRLVAPVPAHRAQIRLRAAASSASAGAAPQARAARLQRSAI